MFGFGGAGQRPFGGVGLMVERPGIQLEMTASAEPAASGPLAQRARRTVERLGSVLPLPDLPAARVVVHAAAPEHVGLGTGTQLALAVAAGWLALGNRPVPAADELARLAGRGRRSSIGSHGFVLGGLLVDEGHRTPQRLAALSARVELPEAWRWVLVRPGEAAGLSGEAEQTAFDRLPHVPPRVTAQLWELAQQRVLPAARAGRFADFARSIYEFGRAAGALFAPVQGGVYASQAVDACVAAIRREGIEGVVQSSWGPTLAVVVPDEAAAAAIVRLLEQRAGAPLDLLVTRTANRGATFEVIDGPE